MTRLEGKITADELASYEKDLLNFKFFSTDKAKEYFEKMINETNQVAETMKVSSEINNLLVVTPKLLKAIGNLPAKKRLIKNFEED